MTNRLVNINILAVLLLTFHFIGCTGGRQDKKSEEADIIEVNAPGSLFNGKTLDGWEITNFGPQGPVYVSGDAIILAMGDGCTGITWKKDFPDINYEVTLEAKREEGNDFFCGMTFPVGKDPCTLIIGGWGGTTVGLSCINGLDASENETTTLRKFEKDRWYAIRLQVTENEIKAWIDEDLVVDFTIADNILSIRPEVELSKPFGIASWMTRAAIRNIRVNKIE
jgi:hypothetical protein